MAMAIGHAFVPVPRQTASDSASRGYNIQNNSQAKQNPSTPTPPSAARVQDNPNSTPAAKTKTENEKTKQDDVSIITPNGIQVNKDWRDKWAWGFNGLLVLVGICGVVAAVCTLLFIKKQIFVMKEQADSIKRQADLMDRQIVVMTRQGIAAETAAKAAENAIILASDTAQKQLRAYIGVDSACVKFIKPGSPEAQVHIKNYGQTPAYDVQSWIHIWFNPYPPAIPPPNPPDDLLQAKEPLPPGRESILIAPTINNPLTIAQIDAVSRNQAAHYVHSWRSTLLGYFQEGASLY
jgi:hypothetical protein